MIHKKIFFALLLLNATLSARNITIAHDEPDDKVQEYFLSLKGAYEHVTGKNNLAGDTYKTLKESFPEHSENTDFNTARLKLAYQEGRHDDVINNSAAITENVKTHPELSLVLAQAYVGNEKLSHAEEVLREVLEHHPSNDAALSQLTVLLIKQRKFLEALELIKKGIENIELSNKHYLLYFLLAKLHFFSGSTELAITSIEKSIELNPRSARSVLFQAALLEQQGRIEAAINSYEQYLQLINSDPSIVNKLIQLYFQEKKYTRAQELLESHPAQTASYFHDLALVNHKQGNPQAALAAINTSLSLDPTFAKAYACKVEILLHMKKQEDVVDVLFALLDQQPHNTQALSQLTALVENETISIDELQRKAQQQSEQNPNYLLAFGIGELLQKHERYARACEWYHSALNNHSVNADIFSPIQSQILFQLAYIAYIREEYSKMLEHLTEAQRCHTVDPFVYNFHAWYLAEQNIDLKTAHQKINNALKNNPNNPYFLDTKGYIYKQQKNQEQALVYIRKAHTIAPKDPIISRRHIVCSAANSY